MTICEIVVFANCETSRALNIMREAFLEKSIDVSFGSANDVTLIAAMLGKRGGSSTSKRKAAASRRNGKRGGRPRKSATGRKAKRNERTR